ncbi:MAG: S41 family peptidase [Bacteroidota bacterium]
MKTLRLFALLPVFFVLLFSACSDSVEPQEPAVPIVGHSTVATNYLNEVLDIMEENSINRYNIDWSDFRATVFAVTDGAITIEDTYPGIEKALELLADNHSFFVKPDGTGFSASTVRCNLDQVTVTSWPENIGYVKVNSFSGGGNTTEALTFAQEIQQQIRDQDNDQLRGWIVDLRGNLGGNMWPMIAGIGPVLGEGIAGYFIDPDNNENSWGFANGASVSNGQFIITQINNSYSLIAPNPKVAVLLNDGIASSGEVVAISFIGRDNTRSFGSGTCGLSTGNTTFPLSDGSNLFLTTVYLADRDKNAYGGVVEPDVLIENEDIIQVASDWILE